jgi:thiol-disulfide isomerase/thioredoxin
MTTWNVLTLVLCGVVLLQTLLIVVLYRQVGLVYLGFSSTRVRDGLPVGSRAPEFRGVDGSGRECVLGDFAGAPLVLVFAEAGCAPCRALMPELQRFADDHRGEVGVVVVGSDDPVINAAFEEEHLRGVPIITQEADETSQRYQIRATPFAYVVDANGEIRDRGVINYATQLEHMLEGLRPTTRGLVGRR